MKTDYNEAMQYTKVDYDVRTVKVLTTDQMISDARQIARSKGMTLQGWLGKLIEKEVEDTRKEVANG